MSIILKALKKIQEQEAGRGAGQPASSPPARPSDDSLNLANSKIPATPPDIADGKGTGGHAAFSPAGAGENRVEDHMGASPPQGARPTFGLGPKALLGVLVFVGIATVGWFVASLYVGGSGRSNDTVAPQAPVVANASTPVAASVEKAPAPALASTASISTPPSVAQGENTRVAEQATRFEPEAVRFEPVDEPVFRAVEQTEAVAEVPATSATPVATAIFTRPVAPPELAAPVMKEAAPEKKERPKFKINAIAWKNKEPRAIVNMQSVYEGDMIEGATVLIIKRKAIVLEYEGEIFDVRFGI